MDDSFDLAIKDHLELKQRNRLLEAKMPLSEYRDGPVRNGHAAITLEDTQEWVMPESPALFADAQEWVVPDAPAVLEHEQLFPAPEELWSGTPAFDWGD